MDVNLQDFISPIDILFGGLLSLLVCASLVRFIRKNTIILIALVFVVVYIVARDFDFIPNSPLQDVRATVIILSPFIVWAIWWLREKK